jgi:hypothetical protein
MSDETERSCASRGSHDEPIGHQQVDEYGRPSGFLSWRDGETRWPKSQTVPLYLAPQPTLTDEERDDITIWLAECLRQCSATTGLENGDVAERWRHRALRAGHMLTRFN